MFKANHKDVVLVSLLLTLIDFEHLSTHWVWESVRKYQSAKTLHHIEFSPGFYMIWVLLRGILE